MEKILLVIHVTFGISVVLYLLLLIPYTLTVGRHFDQWFRDKKPIAAYSLPFYFPGISHAARAITYGSCVALPFLSKNSGARKLLYGNFNFKEHATKFQIVFSYIFMYQIVIVAITTVLMMALKAIMWLMQNGIFMTTT